MDRIARAALTIILLAVPALAPAQTTEKMTVQLGNPPAIGVEFQYQDPGDLFTRLAGSRLIPVWVVARNVSGAPVTLNAADIVLRLGGADGVARLTALDAPTVESEFRRSAALPGVLRAIAQQGGDWGPNPFAMRFPDGQMRPGAAKKGFVFFLRPVPFRFNGFMTLAAGTFPEELANTAAVRTTVTTRAAGLGAVVSNVINSARALATAAIYGTPFGKSYALLFGVSDYEHLDNLELVKRDLARMSAFLTTQGFDKVVVVANRDVTAATLRNIQAHFQNQIRPDDRLLVYYSGHGRRATSGDQAYLVLSRSPRAAPTADTDIPMRDFMSWMLAVKVKHLLVLLDACHSGSAIGGTARAIDAVSLDGASREQLYTLSNQGGRYVITAGDADQNAHEDRRWDGGLFTSAVLRALQAPAGSRGPRLVSTFELFTRVKAFVLDEVRRNNLTAQTPLIQDLGFATAPGLPPAVSRGEFVFVSGT